MLSPPFAAVAGQGTVILDTGYASVYGEVRPCSLPAAQPPSARTERSLHASTHVSACLPTPPGWRRPFLPELRRQLLKDPLILPAR